MPNKKKNKKKNNVSDSDALMLILFLKTVHSDPNSICRSTLMS